MTFVSEVFATEAGAEKKAAALALRLHQAAQPLTVLQGCLELALTQPHTAEEYKCSIERALDESRRVSACFDRIRELVQSSPSMPGRSDAGASAERSKAPRVADSKPIGCLHV
jgi:hypothetical protein